MKNCFKAALLFCATALSLNKVTHLCPTNRVNLAHKCAAINLLKNNYPEIVAFFKDAHNILLALL